MKEQITEISNDIKEIKSIVNKLDKELFKQHHDIYGNGKKGLIERVEDLETDNKNIIKRISYFSGVFAIIGYFLKEAVDFIKIH